MPSAPAHLLPVASLNGVGAQTARRLEKLGLRQLQDLLFHLPLRYQDRSRITPIAALRIGQDALTLGRILALDPAKPGARGSRLCRIDDGSGVLRLRFFHFGPFQERQLKPGTLLGCYGEIRAGFHGLEIIHPEYKIVDSAEQLLDPHLTPVYPLTEGISQNLLRKLVAQALTLCLNDPAALNDYLPPGLPNADRFPDLKTALQRLHHPPAGAPLDALARQRLAFEELLAHRLALGSHKQRSGEPPAPAIEPAETELAHFRAGLPFQLTGAQQRAIREIILDCRQNRPMLRLLQGDVGSGKTVVAAAAALNAIAGGHQTAVMAPTEILAEQLHHNFQRWFGSHNAIAYLSGQQKGKQRRQILDDLREGRAQIVIGTHALFQDEVQFRSLGLIIIDEQHRFGVNQRLALREKGHPQGLTPHQLSMTATPIPRSLAMLQYSEFQLSALDERPPGRLPVATRAIPAARRQEIVDRIAEWIQKGRQAYWVCTLIEESEQLECEAAEKTAAQLAAQLPGARIGLAHGRLKAADKEAVMRRFKQGEIDLLVATTVIEVGVDVANADLMIIENPERLGLAQLHQLRGRVGRGSQAGYCLLVYQPPLSLTAKERLNILKHSHDGFEIAEKDLQLRGPGEIMGTRQTGPMSFKIADLSRDQNLIPLIPNAAARLMQDYPETIQPLIRRWLGHGRQYAEV